MFDFKKYQIRAANAQSQEEKAAINQELKDQYAALSAEEKKEFNIQLTAFLAKEYDRLSDDYQAIKEQV